MKKILLGIASLIAVFGLSSTVYAETTATPSTNDENREKDWAHVNVLDKTTEDITLEFVSERSFVSCFEYRTDGDTSQKIDDDNYNTDIEDGLYPFECLDGGTLEMTFRPDEYVEVRMVFGGERDERFDWTRFDLLFSREADITAPEPGEILRSPVLLEAYLLDDDEDNVQWAVREGTCAAGTNTVAGNVDGYSTYYYWEYTSEDNMHTFSSEVKLSPGDYCFVFNPKEDGEEDNIRLTREFTVRDDYKSEILFKSGVPGKGLMSAPGLQKPFNPKSKAAQHAGKK